MYNLVIYRFNRVVNDEPMYIILYKYNVLYCTVSSHKRLYAYIYVQIKVFYEYTIVVNKGYDLCGVCRLRPIVITCFHCANIMNNFVTIINDYGYKTLLQYNNIYCYSTHYIILYKFNNNILCTHTLQQVNDNIIYYTYN